VFENRVLRRIFELKRDEVTGRWAKICIMRSFITCALHQLLRIITMIKGKKDEMNRACITHGERRMHVGY
jgi:hypothetical protein